jgi:hypothetical protein
MPQWLRNSIDEKADSNTSAVIIKEKTILRLVMEQRDRVNIPAHIYSRKYHGKEGRGRKLRLLVLVPQLNVAELNSDKDDKEEEDSSATEKEPREVEGDLTTPFDEGDVRAFGVLFTWKE